MESDPNAFSTDTDGPPAIWRDGVVTVLDPRGLPATAVNVRWRTIDFNDQGAALPTWASSARVAAPSVPRKPPYARSPARSTRSS